MVKKLTFMIDRWIEEVKQTTNPEELGMILIHNGIVRGTSKSGKPVHGMKLSYDEKKLKSVIPIFKHRKGVVEVKVWINAGNLTVGDNIMLLLVAGKFKTDVLPVFEELLALVKNEIVTEEEASS
jgi:molybdopterin synthase catalytic subunit